MKYLATLTKQVTIKAVNESSAHDILIKLCASDSEFLMPHNMTIVITPDTSVREPLNI